MNMDWPLLLRAIMQNTDTILFIFFVIGVITCGFCGFMAVIYSEKEREVYRKKDLELCKRQGRLLAQAIYGHPKRSKSQKTKED